MVPAPSALIGGYLADTVKLPVLAAFWAIQGVAVLHLHKVVQARIIVRESGEKVENCKRLSNCPVLS